MKLRDSCNLAWVTPDAEQLIVKMARVSAPENEDNLATAPRLLKYLIKHKHCLLSRWQICALRSTPSAIFRLK